MKTNLPVTGNEYELSSDIHIVSSTDLKGAITSCNKDFIDVSGFSNEELIGKNHNLVRHPDMPPAAFADLWNDLKLGKPWKGVVKNRCKSGDHYWVDAYITPVYEDNVLIGYQSVRVKPEPAVVKRANSLYRQLNKGGSAWQNIKNKFSFGLMGKIILGYLIAMLPLLVILFAVGSPLSSYGAVLVSALAALIVAKVIALPWQKAAKESRQIFSNAVAQKVFTGRADELGQLQLVINSQESRLKTAIWSIHSATDKLDDIASSTAASVEQTNGGIMNQRAEIEQVASAMNEMTATVHEVALITGNASKTSTETEELASHGALVATSAITSIMGMVSDAEQAANVIRQLAEKTETIGSVLDVIRGIAEQTNLLALNAAIEAARAGEQGRGFAVVADEVRTLASRTHQSTQEIQDMIEGLQVEAQKAVDVMMKAQASAEKNMDSIEEMAENLAEISGSVQMVNSMSVQIAAAVEEQSAVSEEINRNIVNINTVADQTASASEETGRETVNLLAESSRLRSMVKQFCSE